MVYAHSIETVRIPFVAVVIVATHKQYGLSIAIFDFYCDCIPTTSDLLLLVGSPFPEVVSLILSIGQVMLWFYGIQRERTNSVSWEFSA